MRTARELLRTLYAPSAINFPYIFHLIDSIPQIRWKEKGCFPCKHLKICGAVNKEEFQKEKLIRSPFGTNPPALAGGLVRVESHLNDWKSLFMLKTTEVLFTNQSFLFALSEGHFAYSFLSGMLKYLPPSDGGFYLWFRR